MVTHTVRAHGGHGIPSANTSSVQPTGWIRSGSLSTPNNRPIMGDRTNLPPSRSTPGTHPSVKPAPSFHRANPSFESVGSTKINRITNSGNTQQTLSSFFMPRSAPPAPKCNIARMRGETVQHEASPSVSRSKNRKDRDRPKVIQPEEPQSDEELEARARNLLRGRFGSLSRSLDPSPAPQATPASTRSNATTPSASISSPPSSSRDRISRSDETSHRSLETTSAAYVPSRTPSKRKLENALQSATQSSHHPELLYLDESLSNFTPPNWEKALGPKMALFQRLAGLPDSLTKELQEKKALEQLEKAHERLHAQSPPSTRRAPRGASDNPSVPKVREPKADRVGTRNELQRGHAPEQLEAESREAEEKVVTESLSRDPAGISLPKAAFRSPTSNRKVFVLETQFPQRSPRSFKPTWPISQTPIRSHRFIDTETRMDLNTHAVLGWNGKAMPSAEDIRASFAETYEDESETQPLPWAEDEEGSQFHLESGEGRLYQEEETQVLPWNPEEAVEEGEGKATEEHHRHRSSGAEDLDVPTSDHEDRLLVTAECSSAASSPPLSPSARRSPSISAVDRVTTPGRSEHFALDSSPPNSSRSTKIRRLQTATPQSKIAKVSPITLASQHQGTQDRFATVVAALQKAERKSKKGMQLSLNSFYTSKERKTSSQAEDGTSLGLDLDEQLSDDDEEELLEGDITPQYTEVEETQPLPWPIDEESSEAESETMTLPPPPIISQTSRQYRNRPSLTLSSSQTSTSVSGTGSGFEFGSSISLPSSAMEDVESPTRTFIRGL